MFLAQLNFPRVTAYVTASGSLTYSPHAAAEYRDPLTAYRAACDRAADFPDAYPLAIPAL